MTVSQSQCHSRSNNLLNAQQLSHGINWPRHLPELRNQDPDPGFAEEHIAVARSWPAGPHFERRDWKNSNQNRFWSRWSRNSVEKIPDQQQGEFSLTYGSIKIITKSYEHPSLKADLVILALLWRTFFHLLLTSSWSPSSSFQCRLASWVLQPHGFATKNDEVELAGVIMNSGLMILLPDKVDFSNSIQCKKGSIWNAA